MKLTSKERILRIFQNKETDRPALKLWGAGIHGDYNLLNPAYQPVSKLAWEISDLFLGVGFRFNPFCGIYEEEYFETWTVDTNKPFWKEKHIVYHTPKGDLHTMKMVSTIGEPGYIMEYLLKEPEDMEKVLSMKYAPYPIDRTHFDRCVGMLGDRGVVMPAIAHAGYVVQDSMGSETLAYFSVDCREELQHLIDVIAQRILEHTTDILDAGINAPFNWVGPEVFLPPLMSPADFQDFVFTPDKPICDLIHDRGSYVWVHSHGKVAEFIDSFIDMGVDVLNPLEPPKNGDIHLGNIIAQYGNRIGWEGNIEIQDLLLSAPEQVRHLIDECVEYGSRSGRFILCPSAGFNEYVYPTQQYIDNLMLYLNYGHEVVEKYRNK